MLVAPQATWKRAPWLLIRGLSEIRSPAKLSYQVRTATCTRF